MVEYQEPTNEQLGKFLAVRGQTMGLNVSPEMLELQMDHNPELRRIGLEHHRKFVEEINEYSRKIQAGELRCEYIRPNGKQCPNHNTPGEIFCGLHKDRTPEEAP